MTKNNKLSYLSYGISCFGGILFGIILVLSDVLYSETDEIKNTPVWYQVTFYLSFCVFIIGLVLSVIFRRRESIKGFEFKLGIICFFASFIFLSLALARRNFSGRGVIICIGAVLFFGSIASILSSFIGYLRKEKKIKK